MPTAPPQLKVLVDVLPRAAPGVLDILLRHSGQQILVAALIASSVPSLLCVTVNRALCRSHLH